MDKVSGVVVEAVQLLNSAANQLQQQAQIVPELINVIQKRFHDLRQKGVW